MSKNKLRSLPSSIGGCLNLEKLDCCQNLLEVIPVELCACHRLTTLNVDDNRLLRLPWQIMNLAPSLRHLSLRNNKLQCVPSSILCLRKLTTFSVYENPLLKLNGHTEVAEDPDLHVIKFASFFTTQVLFVSVSIFHSHFISGSKIFTDKSIPNTWRPWRS